MADASISRRANDNGHHDGGHHDGGHHDGGHHDGGHHDGPLASLRKAADRNPATKRLLTETEDYLSAQAQRVASWAGHKLGATTRRITDLAEGKATPALRDGAHAVGETVTGAVRGVLPRRGRARPATTGRCTNIVEDIDVGVPVSTAYDQWTQFREFRSFAQGVRQVEDVDDTTTDWDAKVGPVRRRWRSRIVEQVPDQRIAWITEAAKGTVRGVVSFHPLAENLTRVLLVLEYRPRGLVERVGNLWRAQGRRVRLDLKHFRRFVMLRGDATGAWRGEIHDGDVVPEQHDKSHEDGHADPNATAKKASTRRSSRTKPTNNRKPSRTTKPSDNGSPDSGASNKDSASSGRQTRRRNQ